MEKDNVISLEQYRNEKQKRENPTADIEERLSELDYPADNIESAQKYAEILSDSGMSNEDIVDTMLSAYGDMLDTPYDERTDSLENITQYRQDKERKLAEKSIEDTIYVIYGGGEQQSMPVHNKKSRRHLRVVDNSK